jgi:fibro-slime domain-containing protein
MSTTRGTYRAKAQARVQMLFAVVALCGACDSSNTTSTCSGGEKCACYRNKTCDEGLICRSDLCVSKDGDGGDGGNASSVAGSGPGNGGASANASGGSSVTPEGGAVSTLGGAAPTVGGSMSSGGALAGGAPSTASGASGGAITPNGGASIGGTLAVGGVLVTSGTASTAGGAIPGNGGTSAAGTTAGGAATGGGTSAAGTTAGGAATGGAATGGAPTLCGNGTLDTGEACDEGTRNGLYFGNGTGCGKTCVPLPTCRSADGTTQACIGVCGDGHRDATEGCDDGNRVDGDGCSAVCVVESGFTCADHVVPFGIACPSDPSLKCLVLGVTYRDFEGAETAAGHPDFLYLGANGPAGQKMTCIPDASGTPASSLGTTCTSGDPVGVCAGLVKSTLGVDGKPQANLDRNDGLSCPCRYTDWDGTGILTGVTGAESCNDTSGNLHSRIGYATPLKVPMIKDAASFAQWYNPSDMSTSLTSTLELAVSGTTNQFTFNASMAGAVAGAAHHTIADDIHDIFMGTETTLKSGFFPVESLSGTKVCNLWPYWVAGLQSDCNAGTGHPVASQWDIHGSYTPRTPGTGGPVAPIKGVLRNYHFTTEVRYLYRYNGETANVSISSTDDTWVFINGRLAVDFGATHATLGTTVKIDNTAFGLVAGNLYEIAIFRACRSPRDSDLQLTLPGATDTLSVCTRI